MALSHAMLVALSDCSCSGYDLAKRFDGSVGFFWKASHQQIYRELTKLEDQGLIVAGEVIQQSGRPAKTLYELTELGRSHLRDWIAGPTKLAPTKDELLVKLFAGDLVETATILQLLEEQQYLHQAQLKVYQGIEQEHFPQPEALSEQGRFQYLTLRNGIHFERGWLDWCEEAIANLTASGGDHSDSSATAD